MKKAVFIYFFIFMFIFNLNADRMAPKKVEPVNYNGVIYKVNHEKMGFIEAWDEKSNKLLWEVKIYKVNYNIFLERDVQDIYIKNIFIKNEFLIIIDELSRYYSLDIKTKKVKKLTEDEIKIINK